LMIEDSEKETKGYGIMTNMQSDLNYPLLTVDCEHQTVSEGKGLDKKSWTFNEFITENFEEVEE